MLKNIKQVLMFYQRLFYFKLIFARIVSLYTINFNLLSFNINNPKNNYEKQKNCVTGLGAVTPIGNNVDTFYGTN